ncbi:MAG: tetratricopeptide repeat protein [Pyrinomonadaceae bacterium]
MHRILLIAALSILGLSLAACSSAPAPANSNGTAPMANTSRPNTNGPIAAHDVPGAPPGAPTRPPGGPTGDPIDTAKLDADIDKTEKAHQSKPADAGATKALADAYFARADALTEARQYRSALGDYRKGLKLDPSNESARKMHDQIIDIFNQMGREVPAEGTEPPAMRK